MGRTPALRHVTLSDQPIPFSDAGSPLLASGPLDKAVLLSPDTVLLHLVD
ncbi:MULTISPECIES: hypothetical protein [unclassified Streptomyces]|nr:MULTISPECIES: hypothetical protein [unclassified Streptomyces]